MIADGQISQEVAEIYFPELKESGDEKIMKFLIKCVEQPMGTDFLGGIKKEDVLAWLEKQGEQNTSDNGIAENIKTKIIDYFDNHLMLDRCFSIGGLKNDILRIVNEAKQGEQKKSVFEMKTPEESLCIDSDTYRKIVDECIFGEQKKPDYCHHKVDLSNCSEEYRKAYYDGWNNCNMQHSQCKSESNDVVKCLINGMKFYYEDNDEWGTDKFSMKVKDILSWLEKQCDQKSFDYENANIQQKDFAPKVEPRFKIGEWVVQENIGVYKVIEICESWYEVIDAEDNHYSISFDKEYMCHSWDISDAKDGNVLVTVDDNLPFIYKGCLDPNHPNSPFAYCGIYAEGNFSSNWDEVNRRWTDVKVQPATKEQRDLLFQKMREAGYEWDAKKKELKKIEHKHFCELDNSYTCVKFPFKAKVKSSDTIVTIHGGQLSLDGKEWIKYQSDAEDGYEVYEPNNLELVCEIEQNPAWSEEDECYMSECISAIATKDGWSFEEKRKTKHWLESIKNRMNWKPSDEQIEILNMILTNESMDDNIARILRELRKQLKNLKRIKL